MQTPWGFRVKATSETELSDEKIIQKSFIYSLGEVIGSQEEVDGAIYYNKRGFDKSIKTYDEVSANQITVAPTGRSSNFNIRYKDSQFIKDGQANAGIQ